MEVPRFPNAIKFLWAAEMAQRIKHLLDKPSSIPGSHVVEGKNQLSLIAF